MTGTYPGDIIKAAEAVVDRGYNEGLVDAVCRAIMTERHRCADIIMDCLDEPDKDELYATCHKALDLVLEPTAASPTSDPTPGSSEGRRGA